MEHLLRKAEVWERWKECVKRGLALWLKSDRGIRTFNYLRVVNDYHLVQSCYLQEGDDLFQDLHRKVLMT